MKTGEKINESRLFNDPSRLYLFILCDPLIQGEAQPYHPMTPSCLGRDRL